MTRKRRTHRPEFKVRVALEALKGVKPVHQIASEDEVHPAQVTQWKKELKARMAELFERKNGGSKKDDDELQRIERLERKVGQLIIQRDWLAIESKELGID